MYNRNEIMKAFDEFKEYTEERINYGIERNRKGYCRLKLTDKDGNVIKGAKIHVNQKKHEFKFGANLFMLEELETAEKNEKYKDYFANLFNMATLPFYWNDLEPEKGKQRYDKNSPKIYRRPTTDLCMEYCKEHDIEPREHALCYDRMFPKWLCGADTLTVKRELSRRIKEIADRYSKDIPTMEVTNETFWKDSVTDFYFDDDFVEWCFKETRKHMPGNQLVINEYAGVWDYLGNGTNRDLYYMQIERAIANGAPIDAIGMQYHMFFKKEEAVNKTHLTYNPIHLYKILDRYAKLNKPIQITEITIPAYSHAKEDEELQAEILTNLYSIWFSHGNVEQIIYWNLVDGYAAFAPQGDMTAGENYYYGGLVRFDFTKKPSYYALENLIKNVWHTESNLESDNNGEAVFKGFFGDYIIDIEYNGKLINKTIDYKKINRDKKVLISL